MVRKITVVFALAVVLLMPAASIYAMLKGGVVTPDDAGDVSESIALWYLESCPTFSFDGIVPSIQILDVKALESYPVQYIVTISFECSHAGYGNRTGQVLAQVITPHEIVITIIDGKVVSAIIDGYWDEIKQHEEVRSELIPPEMAKDLAVQYILENYPDLLVELPEVWSFEILTSEGIVGASVQQFVGNGWVVNVSFPVIAKPDYKVSIRYDGIDDFEWEGSVKQSCYVEESLISVRPRILSQEDARDIAVAYLLENFEDLEGLEAPSEWSVEDLTPEGLVGYFKQEFTAGGWTVRVGNPVVWKPVFEVEVEYGGEFSWKGTVDQSGSVETTK